MWTLHPDVQITRRGRLFLILDGDGILQWSGSSFLAALSWLKENDIWKFDVNGEGATYRMEFYPIAD